MAPPVPTAGGSSQTGWTRGALPEPLLFCPGQGRPAGHRAAPKLPAGQSTAGDRTRPVPDATRIGSCLPQGTPGPVPSQPRVLPAGAAAARAAGRRCFPSQ